MAEILVTVIAGYITGHTALRRCVRWCKDHEKWFRDNFGCKNGIASLSTVSRLLCKIDAELFMLAFMEWIGEILNTKGIHIAIDGKALRASLSKVKEDRTPMLLHAIDTATGLVLAQLPLEGKENEITKIPDLLSLLDLQDSIVTIDAIGTQTEIMKQILFQGGHFVMVVKKNQPNSLDEINTLFDQLESDMNEKKLHPRNQSRFPDEASTYSYWHSVEKNRDRYEYRSFAACRATSYFSKSVSDWPFVQTVGYAKQMRILVSRDSQGNDITPSPDVFLKQGSPRQPAPSLGEQSSRDVQNVGLISDLPLSAEELAKCKRSHWSIENRLHHVLDDTFREDRSSAKQSKYNLALIRKFAYNILRIMSIRLSVNMPLTELMDHLSDNLSVLEPYLFNGIPSFY